MTTFKNKLGSQMTEMKGLREVYLFNLFAIS